MLWRDDELQPQRADDHNHLPPRFGGSAILFIIILGIIIAGVPQQIYHYFTANEHAKIKEYLDVGQEYSLFLNGPYHMTLQQLPRVSENELNEHITTISSFQQEFFHLTPPLSFQRHHESLMQSVTQTEMLLETAKRYIQEPNSQTIYNEMNRLQMEIDGTNRQMMEHLIEGLDKERMDYEILEDGTVVYYVRVKNELERLQYKQQER